MAASAAEEKKKGSEATSGKSERVQEFRVDAERYVASEMEAFCPQGQGVRGARGQLRVRVTGCGHVDSGKMP